MATPTLKTIEKLINANHAEVQTRLMAVEEQVKLTNGRVKALETAEEVAKGVERYKKEIEAQTSSNPKVDWSKWISLAAGFLLGAVAAGIAIGKAIGK